MRREPFAVRAYRTGVRLLPRAVRDQDGDEMAAAFAEVWAGLRGPVERVRWLARSFGGLAGVMLVERWEHLGRRGGAGVPVDALVRSLRLGLRSLLRAPTFTWTTVLLLGLGVGAVTTVFTIADHLFLRPLPYPHAERLIRVQNGAHSHPSLRDFQAMPSVEAWAAASTDEVNLAGAGDPVRLVQARVTEGFFAFFGARPGLGRLLLPEDFAAADVVVLSAGAWDRIWGGDPGIVGRTIRIDGAPVRVVGVLDPAFVEPEAMLDDLRVDVWRPIDRSHPMIEDRGWQTLEVAGRLAAGATLEEASRDAAFVAERRAEAFPERYMRRDGNGVIALPIVTLQEATVGPARAGVGLLLGAVTLLLLVACANVAHLFMARGLGRARDLAVRRALGAATRVLAGQLLVESLLVAAGGTLVGALLAWLGLRAFLALSPDAVPRAAALAVDGRVLAFAALLSALTAVVFGLLPTLRLLGGHAGDGLRMEGRSSTASRGARSLRAALVTAEVAISLVLVFSAGLLMRSFDRLHDQPLGFRVEDVWTLPLGLVGDEDMATWSQRVTTIAGALRRTPGVRSVTWGLSVPLEHTGGTFCCWRTGVTPPRAEATDETMVHPWGGDHLDVLEPTVLAGRGWSPAEAAVEPFPALLNESLAIELYGSAGAAVGRSVVVSRASHVVVGVIADDRHYGIDIEHGPAVHIPMAAVPFVPGDVHVAVRVEGAASEMPRRLREAVWSVEPDLPVPLVRSMEQWAQRARARSRFDSALFTAFGVLALLLAAGGLYGTLLYMVGAERREMGIRMALGAGRREIEGRVLLRGLRIAVAGAALGAVGAWASGRLLESRLFEVQPGDPATLALAAGVLIATALAACWHPARRAGATDPLDTLRQE